MALLQPCSSFKVTDFIPSRSLGAHKARGRPYVLLLYAWGMGVANEEASPPAPWVIYLLWDKGWRGAWLGRTRRWDLGPERWSLLF